MTVWSPVSVSTSSGVTLKAVTVGGVESDGERRVGEARAPGAEARLEILPVELDEVLDLVVDAQVRDPPEARGAARRQDQRPLVVTLERASGDAVHVGEGGLRPGGGPEVDLDEPDADLVVGEVHPDGEGLVRGRGVDDGGGQGERGDLRRVRVVGARRGRQRRGADEEPPARAARREDLDRGPPRAAPAHAAPPRSGGRAPHGAARPHAIAGRGGGGTGGSARRAGPATEAPGPAAQSVMRRTAAVTQPRPTCVVSTAPARTTGTSPPRWSARRAATNSAPASSPLWTTIARAGASPA